MESALVETVLVGVLLEFGAKYKNINRYRNLKEENNAPEVCINLGVVKKIIEYSVTKANTPFSAKDIKVLLGLAEICFTPKTKSCLYPSKLIMLVTGGCIALDTNVCNSGVHCLEQKNSCNIADYSACWSNDELQQLLHLTATDICPIVSAMPKIEHNILGKYPARLLDTLLFSNAINKLFV